MSESFIPDLDLLACPKCHSPLRLEGEFLVCSKCGNKWQNRSGLPCFLPRQQSERFAQAQAAEEQHHKDAWGGLDYAGFRGVTSIEEYQDWLESFYRVSLAGFGFATGYFRKAAIVEIGSGPFGMLGCIPHARGLAIDPLMSSFAGYMRQYWRKSPIRVASMGEELPARSGTFDAALAINTLDHTLEPEKILKEVYRVLKPGALFIINNNVKSRAGKSVGSFGERFKISRLTEVFHPHAFTKTDLTKGCQLAGFELVADVVMKSSEPEEIRRRSSWKHAVKRWVENECALWLLVRKPNVSRG